MEIISNLLPRAVSTPDGTKTTTNRFNLSECLQFLERTGKKVYGEHFKLYPEDQELHHKLLVYFLRDEENARKLGMSLRKGLLLTGPVGCGKTSLMTLFRYLLPRERNYALKPCREVSFEFMQEGFPVIHRYSKQAFCQHHSEMYPKIYCFDDLGVESSLKFYGNSCNIMAEILLSRYDLFISRGMLTHITTNLTSSEIEQLYGDRVRSRLREMCNKVNFGKEAKDRRQ